MNTYRPRTELRSAGLSSCSRTRSTRSSESGFRLTFTKRGRMTRAAASARHALALVWPALACLACSSENDALRHVHCDPVVAPLLTHLVTYGWGSRFACVRLATRSAAEREALTSGCELAHRPLSASTYPVQAMPVAPPAWWDLRDGERVDFASVYVPQLHWHAFLYRKGSAPQSLWYLCAGAD